MFSEVDIQELCTERWSDVSLTCKTSPKITSLVSFASDYLDGISTGAGMVAHWLVGWYCSLGLVC